MFLGAVAAFWLLRLFFMPGREFAILHEYKKCMNRII